MVYQQTRDAFTLVELSIVLVILGLLVGGVLSGQSLIKAAVLNGQIKQIDQYKTVSRAFRDKYFYLPGDLPNAAAFGFHERNNACAGFGDGNSLVEGARNPTNPCQIGSGRAAIMTGEALLFWQDLNKSGMLGLPLETTATGQWINSISAVDLSMCLPAAKLGNQLYVAAYSGGTRPNVSDGVNYFAVMNWTAGAYCNYDPSDYPFGGKMTVQQAYNIDTKLDDGLPQSGGVQAFAPMGTKGQANWAAGLDVGEGASTVSTKLPTTAATAYNVDNCYDNSGVVGPQKYSLRNADIEVCNLSFKM